MKDSTVLLDLVRRVYLNILAVFSDTGLEYPEIKSFVKSVDNVRIVKPEMRFDEVIRTYGYPVIGKRQARSIRDLQNRSENNQNSVNLILTGITSTGKTAPTFKLADKWIDKFYHQEAPFRVSEQCCEKMKKESLRKFEKESGMHPITGIMACESSMREKSYMQQGCNAFDAKRPISQPMGFWTEQDVLAYLKEFDIPYCSVYGDIVEVDGKLVTTGEERTGCMFCMFGAHLEKEPNRFQRMRLTHPKQYDYCIRPLEDNGLGLGTVSLMIMTESS
jgi:3'-phosphoadenosine 5'-phosphosulfate sulfotransferase (PAPS reductase)/FAD synthetase